MYRRTDQFRPARQPNTEDTRSTSGFDDGDAPRQFGSRVKEAISGFSIFDDADRQESAPSVAAAKPKAPLQQHLALYKDPFIDARRTLQVVVGVAVGMSMMAIVYVFAKLLTASLMKLAPLH